MLKKLSGCCGALTYIGESAEWELERAVNSILSNRLFELCESCHQRVMGYIDDTRANKQMLAALVLQGLLMNPRSTNFATSPEETLREVEKFVSEVQRNGLF